MSLALCPTELSAFASKWRGNGPLTQTTFPHGDFPECSVMLETLIDNVRFKNAATHEADCIDGMPHFELSARDRSAHDGLNTASDRRASGAPVLHPNRSTFGSWKFGSLWCRFHVENTATSTVCRSTLRHERGGMRLQESQVRPHTLTCHTYEHKLQQTKQQNVKKRNSQICGATDRSSVRNPCNRPRSGKAATTPWTATPQPLARPPSWPPAKRLTHP